MVEIYIQRRLFCQDIWTKAKFVYEHCYFNLFHPIVHFLRFWANVNLMQKLKVLSVFSGMHTLKERGRWNFKTPSKSGFCFQTWCEPSALRRRKLRYSSVQPACSFQDYRLQHCFLQGTCWNFTVGNESLYSLLRTNTSKVITAPQAAEKLVRIIKINSSIFYLKVPLELYVMGTLSLTCTTVLQICSVDFWQIKPCDNIISVFCFVYLFCSVVGDTGISLLPARKYNDYRK